MPRAPQIHHDENTDRFYFTHLGKKHALKDRKKIEQRFRRLVGRGACPQKPVIVPELAELWLSKHETGDLHKDYCLRYSLRYWCEFETRPLRELDLAAIEDYHLFLKDIPTIGPSNIINMIRSARRISQWAYDRGLLHLVPRKPRDMDAKPKGHRDIKPHELLDALDKLDATTRRERIANLTRFSLAVGARPSEARLLRWDEVDLHGRRCELHDEQGQPRGKNVKRTGKPRVLYLMPAAIEQLSIAEARDGRRHGYVFLTCHRKPYTMGGFLSALKNVTGFTTYQLRHTWAQLTLDRNVAKEDVAKIMDSSRSVDVYCEVRDHRAAAVAQDLDAPWTHAADLQAAHRSYDFGTVPARNDPTPPVESAKSRSVPA